MLVPAMRRQKLKMLFGRVALTLISGVAFDHGAVHKLDHRLPEFGMQEVLIALFTGVNLDGYSAGKLRTCGFIKLNDFFGAYIS